jgi:1-acyl-sn-glycerol-3-phosphate acyltransferase
MALEAGCPVLPVVMIGTEKIQPPGRKIPKLGRVGMTIGKPLDFSRYEGMEGDRFVLRSITDEIMYELMELSGAEYVDIYAQVAKDRLKAEKAEKAEKAAAGKSEPAPSDDTGSTESTDRPEQPTAPAA